MSKKNWNLYYNYANSLIASFYGCDGGNLQYPIWFCGIEHGGDFDKNIEEIMNSMSKNLSFESPSSWKTGDLAGYEGSIYAQGNLNRYICAFYAYYENIVNLEDQRNFDQFFVDQNNILYPDSSGIGFKMNLFPFRKKSLNSKNEFNQIIKKDYKQQIFTLRRDFFLKQIKENKTKLIICFGISNLQDFYQFFTKNSEEEISKEQYFIVEQKNGMPKSIKYYEFLSIENCKILVIPFIGKTHGFNGYKEIFHLSNIIKNYI